MTWVTPNPKELGDPLKRTFGDLSKYMDKTDAQLRADVLAGLLGGVVLEDTLVYCSGALTVTTTPTTVTGCSITVANAGVARISATCDLRCTTVGAGTHLDVGCYKNGVAINAKIAFIFLNAVQNDDATYYQQWQVPVAATDVIDLRGSKNVAAGVGVIQVNTSLRVAVSPI